MDYSYLREGILWMNSKRFLNEGDCVSVARNSPLHFGAITFKQQQVCGSLTLTQILTGFAYPPDVKRDCGKI